MVAGSEAVDSLLDRMAVRFAANLEASDSDAFNVNLVRGQSLGSAQQVMEQHQAGSVDVCILALIGSRLTSQIFRL